MNLPSLLSATLVLSLFFQNAEAKFPLNVFKGVTNCLSDNKKHLSPTIGMAALDGGLMENIRFYGNFEAAYRQTDSGPERDYANDQSNDPVWQLVRILFPSTAGQLSGDSAHRYNFGKHVKDPRTLALLINYADDMRSGKMVDEEYLKNDLMASMGYSFKDKMSPGEKTTMAKNLLNRDKRLINGILLEAQLAAEEYGNKRVQDQRRLGEAKNTLLQSLAKKAKRLSNPKITALFMDEIRQFYVQGSKHPFIKKSLAVKPAFFHHVLTEINQAKMAAENVLNHTPMADFITYVEKREPKQKFIIHFKEETLTPLLGAIKEAIHTDHLEEEGFYPKYTPEQALLAFLAYKFSTREDIKAFLTHLKPELVNDHALSLFDSSDLLAQKDLLQIANKETYTVDDVLALSTADLWAMPTPYRVGAPILSNGNTRKYDRKTDSFVPGTFADCVEISIRHLINCFLYDPIVRQFNFKGLAEYHANHLLPPAQMVIFDTFVDFYKIQSVDLANDGSVEIRSQWNRVVGDLNTSGEPFETKVRYHQGTNELDAGFINLMKVFSKVLGLHIKPAPLPTSSLDDKKKWLEKALEEVFTALNPHKGYSIQFNMNKVTAERTEISGIVTISVHDNHGMLYSFDFRSDPDRHGQLQNYLVSDRLKVENYSSHLEKNSFKGKGTENAIWLLAKDPQLQADKNLPLFYQWFAISLADNKARIGFLTKINNLYQNSQTFTLPDQLKVSLKHIVSDMSLDDEHTLKKAAPVLWEVLNREDTKDLISQGLKRAKFGNVYRKLNSQATELVLKAVQVNNSSLTSLVLRNTTIDGAGIRALGKALESNTTLSSLKLKSNDIGNDGAVALAKVLEYNKTLFSLKLELNKIGDTGATALAKALESNTTLFSLSLGSNKIGDLGAAALAKVLEYNKTLSTLNLGSNKIGDLGAAALARVLEYNKTLSSLNLGSNDIGHNGTVALGKLLESNTALSSLNLEQSSIGPNGAIILAEGLKSNKTLISLNLVGNDIGDTGAIAIGKALQSNTTLTSLNLENNSISSSGADNLVYPLNFNKIPITLRLGGNMISSSTALKLYEMHPGRIIFQGSFY